MKSEDSLPALSRRRFLGASASLGLAQVLEPLLPSWARPGGLALAGQPDGLDLSIGEASLQIDGRSAKALTVGGGIPGPLVRLREGEEALLRVSNTLKVDSSIHWHGILLPAEMDGVPGLSFAGIAPGESFTYHFPVKQSGTYWYHSHSGLQEQSGVYGPLVIDPAGPERHAFDREHVVLLSDWTFTDPHRVMARLKKQAGYYNYQRRTVADLLSGRGMPRDAALSWAKMRMDPTDFADVTGVAYTYLLNGVPPGGNWTGLFAPGERVRLRLINGSAMSTFDVRLPGLRMTVIQADGQDIVPVEVEELRIAVAETYDVIVQPLEDRAYTLFAELMDRSGYACGTLAPREGMSAPIPARRQRPLRSMADMGMADMGMGDMGSMDMGSMDMSGHDMSGHDMGSHDMKDMKESAPAAPVMHGPDSHGPGNAMTAMMSASRLHEPGSGLGDDGWRVLTYADLRAAAPSADQRPPGRTIELHLTGNMERYMWSFDGEKFSEVDGPIVFHRGERLRLTLVNDTMMDHPIHLHGMWMELENGAGVDRPRKHTISVKPGERVSALISADAPGDWAFHCHLLYHMEMGMFRVVSVLDSAKTNDVEGS